MRNLIVLLMLLATATTAGSQDVRETQVKMVSEPTNRFGTHWVFMVDTSFSTHKVFGKVKAGFFEALNQQIDELYFSVITFNNEHNQEEWPGKGEEKPFNKDTFKEADAWINDHCGILSYGVKAFDKSIKRNTPNLVIILISDGGFTEDFAVILDSIEKSQQWRINRGLAPATICSIGVENNEYGWPKPPNDVCQAVMRGIGERWGGGYFLATYALD
jgi:hypothetical protein